MARPIKETPILHGEDARRFMEHMRRVDAGELRISPERKAEMIEHHRMMRSIYVSNDNDAYGL